MRLLGWFRSTSSSPPISMVDRLHQAKSLLERDFDPNWYDNGRGGYCAIGAYAKTFAAKDESALIYLNDNEAIKGYKVLNEAAFIVTGGAWINLEKLAMSTGDLGLVLRIYNKAIELSEGRMNPLLKKEQIGRQPERESVSV